MLGARTPETNSICTNALTAIHPMNLAMRLTNKMYWEKKITLILSAPRYGDIQDFKDQEINFYNALIDDIFRQHALFSKESAVCL